MEYIGIMAENNAITINFPEGAGGHMLGRMLASCDNVAWYDHEQNGRYPWLPYNAPDDELFSRLHFNKRFAGAKSQGLDNLRIPPVLSLAESRGITTTKEDIDNWKKRLYPKNFIYTLHEKLDATKELFNPARYIVVIPEDIDLLVDRWLRSSAYYYRDPSNKSYISKDFYTDKANSLGITIRECLENDLGQLIENYKTHVIQDDILIHEINDILDYDFFVDVCERLELKINKNNYQKCKNLFHEYSHL